MSAQDDKDRLDEFENESVIVDEPGLEDNEDAEVEVSRENPNGADTIEDLRKELDSQSGALAEEIEESDEEEPEVHTLLGRDGESGDEEYILGSAEDLFMETPVLGVKKLDPEARLPEFATAGSACCDVFALEDCNVRGDKVTTVRTGLHLVIPEGFRVDVRSKSGLAAKHGVCVLNSPGTIDSDYPGELLVLLTRPAAQSAITPYQVKKGDKIAQISLEVAIPFAIDETTDQTDAGERTGGLGSTGR